MTGLMQESKTKTEQEQIQRPPESAEEQRLSAAPQTVAVQAPVAAQANAQIQQVQKRLVGSTLGINEAAPMELLDLRGKLYAKSITKKEKKLLKKLEAEHRARRKEVKRLEEETRQEDRESIFSALSPEILRDWESLKQDPQEGETGQERLETAKRTVSAMSDKIAELNPEMTELNPTDPQERFKAYRVLIADRVADDSKATELLAELEENLQHSRGMNMMKLRTRLPFYLRDIMREEFEKSSVLDIAAESIADEAGRIVQENQDRWDEFGNRLAAAIGIPSGGDIMSRPDLAYARKSSATADLEEKARQRAAEQDISEEEALRQVFAERRAATPRLENTRLKRDGSWVKGLPGGPEPKTGSGASYRQLSADRETAERMVTMGRGFLYMEEEKDQTGQSTGQYELKATIPERATVKEAEDLGGGKRDLDLRRNYNRLTRMIARGILDENGAEVNERGAKFLSDLHSFHGECLGISTFDKLAYRFKSFFWPLIAVDTTFADEEDAEKAVGDMAFIFKNIMPHEIIASAEQFAATAREQSAMRKNPEALEAKKESCRKYLQTQGEALGLMTAAEITEKKENEKAHPGEGQSSVYNARIDAMLAKLNAIYDQWWQESFTEIQALRDIDVDSPDVFLPGACTASAEMITKIKGGEPDVSDQHYLGDEFIAEHRDFICGRLEELTGRSKADFAVMEDEALRKEYKNYTAYDYHRVSNLGRSADTLFTLETYAATEGEMSAAPFTRKKHLGVYKGKKGFNDYYSNDPHALMTPEQTLIAALKNARLLQKAAV
ncbi:MAG: hypothetical protein LBL37_01060 [Gracilibacteraceae bacterium]|jgi:hypothetical protein|nr:hypothetical protein [Gracilibacteraceae bacterium]